MILFEDKDLIAIDKAAGLSTESGAAAHPSAEKEALEYLLSRQPGMKISYLRAAHRLDRVSSGIVLMAKKKSVLSALMAQFEHRETEKIYWAVVPSGILKTTETTLRHWMLRSPDGKRAVVLDSETAGAQHAILHYKLLKNQGEFSLLEIKLETGRFHQIRAQLAHIGCPIAGDVTYGGTPWQEHQIMLHAGRLTFKHPAKGDLITLESRPLWLENLFDGHG